MKRLLVTIFFGGAVVVAAADVPGLREHETPRATDLLHAKKLAERAERRLHTPSTHGSVWLKGGGGFDVPAEPAPSTDSVTINVRPPRRRPRQR